MSSKGFVCCVTSFHSKPYIWLVSDQTANETVKVQAASARSSAMPCNTTHENKELRKAQGQQTTNIVVSVVHETIWLSYPKYHSQCWLAGF